MAKSKKRNKKIRDSNIWTEDEYDEYMAELYGFEHIAGHTDSGVPYGSPIKDEQVSEFIVYDYTDDNRISKIHELNKKHQLDEGIGCHVL